MRKVTNDNQRRCRARTREGGQCAYQALFNSDYCHTHSGIDPAETDMQDYLTQQFNRRVSIEAGPDDAVRLLRDNLMDINAMIAARRAKITDDASMAANAGAITDLIMKAEKVTVSLNKLAVASGLLLAKPALINWGQQIVQAVSDMVEDKYEGWEEDLVDLSDKVASIIVQAQNVEE